MTKEIAPIALKQRYNILLQKLNSAVIDKNTGKRKDDLFVERVVNLIENGEKFRSRLSVEKIAFEEFGFTDKQFVKELTEYAIIIVARMIAKKYPFEEAYSNLVLLYENQPYSTHQTNISVSLNQYSTPVPISYLIGKYIGMGYNENKADYKQFENIYFNYLKNSWIDRKDTAHLEMIPIAKTNWYPTKVFVSYAKHKDFDYGSEKPDFLNYIKNGGITPPIIVEKSKCSQIESITDGKAKLAENKPLVDCYSVRDGVHRISIYEELGIEMIPAIVYSKSNKSITRDFKGKINSVEELEKFVGVSLREFFQKNINKQKKYLEPTAGNSMLTIAGDPKNIVVNEIDQDRLHVLKKQGFKQVLSQDATKPFPFTKEFDGVFANPPFGGSVQTLVAYGYNIVGLDQQIIVKSLEYLKDDSRAAFIIGGHTDYDEKGRIKGTKDKSFLSYLSRFYFLDDVVNLNGRLYSKQGTSYPIRLIFIRSRKANPEGFYPLKNDDLDSKQPFSPHVVMTFLELFERVKQIIPVN